MRVYTLSCDGCGIAYVYATSVSRDLAVKGYSTCPSCGAWTPFVEPREEPSESAASEIGTPFRALFRFCRKR